MILNDGRIIINFSRDEDNKVIIEFVDRDMGSASFATAEITPENWVKALSGLALVPAKISVDNLDKVGKKKIVEDFCFEIPEDRRYDKQFVKLAALRRCPEGWNISLYFDSKDSFYQKDGKHYARTHIYRWG